MINLEFPLNEEYGLVGLGRAHDSVCLTSFWLGLMLLVFGQYLDDKVPRQLCSLELCNDGIVYTEGC